MAWDAQGRWKPDTQPALAEAAPVRTQQRQITGLLDPNTRFPTNQPTAQPGGPGGPPTPTPMPPTTGDTLSDHDRNRTPGTRPPDNQDPLRHPTGGPGGGQPGGPVAHPLTDPQANGTGTAVATTATPASGTSGFVMPATPTLEDESVTTRLNGLLDSNSPYMQAARMAGIRQANSRGLLNSSIAGGNSEAAAIAAAAPIASQEAAQVATRNAQAMESWYQLRNATTVQKMSDDASWQRLSAQLTNSLQLQGMSDTSAMQRLLAQGDIEKAIATMQNSTSLTQTQINANTSLIGNYMSAFAALAQNPDIPAEARDAYMAEFLRVTQSGQGLVNALSGTEVTWPPLTNPTPTPTPGTTGSGTYTGPTKAQIMAMQSDGTPGNFAAAAAAWNAAHPTDLIPIPSNSSFSSNFPSTSGIGVAGGLLHF